MNDPIGNLCDAIEIARSNGLLYEFLHSYLGEVAGGIEPNQAIASALYEWDM
jgi:hypothetical protein